MIKLSEKTDEWKNKTMDSLESNGRAQYEYNLRLIENYEMVNGKFIFSHYFQKEGYSDLISRLSEEFELPNYLRHYDIIGQVTKVLLGEFENKPDIFHVKASDEKSKNEFIRTKTDFLKKYIFTTIDAEINKKLIEMGLDPSKEDFASEEEAAQYQQGIEQAKSTMQPHEIQNYMHTSWSTAAEQWAVHQLKWDKQRFNLKEKERTEFEDMLVADRCFRHFYLTADGYNQETWNPVNTFFHKSADKLYVEDGDYVGRIHYLTMSDIVDRYGYMMTEEELQSVHERYYPKKVKQKWNESKGSEYVYRDYAVPFTGYQGYSLAMEGLGLAASNENKIPVVGNEFFSKLNEQQSYTLREGYFSVTEAYWKSQKRIGLFTFINPETGQKESRNVDEYFIAPPGVKELYSAFLDPDDEDEPLTIKWTWINEIWKGVKINLGTHINRENAIYLKVKPLEFQFKGDAKLYNAKLPVCGQIFNARNAQSMSVVDLMKPHQIGYNVAMNQLYQLMEKEIGMFMVLDANMLLNQKDWGSEQGLEKFMTVAKSMGITLADTSPQNVKGSIAINGGYLPKIFDMNLATQMKSRIELAMAFENFALKRVGFNEFRLGAFAGTSTAQGVEAGQSASFAQTDSYFTKFSDYLQRTYTMSLDIAQYVQAKNKDVTASYVKSDQSRAFTQIAGIDLLERDLQVYVMASKEYQRQLDMSRQFAIQNNTTDSPIVTLFDMLTMDSISEIRQKLVEAQAKKEADMAAQQQQAAQQAEQQAALQQQQIDAGQQMAREKNDAELDKAYMQQRGQIENQPDTAAPDNSSEIDLKQRKLELDAQQGERDFNLREKELQMKAAGFAQAQAIQEEKLKTVKALKGKDV